jgi:Dockerin type I domain
MKKINYQLIVGRIVALILFSIGLCTGSSRANTYTASYLGGGVWEQDGNWSTTAYPANGHFVIISGDPFPDNNPFYNVVIDIAAPCTLGTSVTVESVSVANGSTLNVLNNSTLDVGNGPLTNNGLITLNSTNSASHLRVRDGSGVSATGVISMSDSAQNYISSIVNHGDTFTIAAGGMIIGAGQLNLGFFGDTQHLLNYVNHGLIEATQPVNALAIGLGNDNNVNSNLTNDGTVRASGSGTLRIRTFGGNATVFNGGGTITAIGNGKVRFAAGILVTGGTLSTSGNGSIHGDNSGGGGGLLSDLTNTGLVAIADGETLALGGTFTNNGSITLDSLGSGAILRFANGTNLAGTGAVTLSNNGSNYLMALGFGDTLNIAPGATVQGAGNISPGFSGGSNMLKITNQGLINANIAAAGLNIRIESSNNTDFTNSGILRASNGGTLSFSGTGTLDNAAGTIEALNSSQVALGGGITLPNYNSSNQTLTGGIYRASDGTLSLNIGSIAVNAATVILSGASAQFSPINSVRQNNGILEITNGANFSVPALPPATFGKKSRALVTSNAFTNTGGLVVGPNSSFTVNGDYGQGAQSSLEIVIGADNPNGFHQLNVTGTAHLAGTLQVTLANGYTPSANQMFDIINAGAIDSGFVTVIGATVTYTATGVSIHPTGASEPLQLLTAKSRKTHNSAGPFSIDLPLSGNSGIECRSSGGNHTFVFTFNHNVVSGIASLSAGIGSISGSPIFSGNTMTVNLIGVANAQTITVALSNVTDTVTEILPNTGVSAHMLIGDVNGDTSALRSVNATDITEVKAQTGQAVTSINFRADITVSGTINSTDISLVKSKSGSGIP